MLVIASHVYSTPVGNNGYFTIIDGIRYNVNTEDGVAGVTTWVEKPYSGNVSIPDTIKYKGYKYPITYIVDKSFYNCQNLKSIKLPKTIKKIGEGSFAHCTQLKEINIPDYVTEIEDSCFSGCTILSDIKLPPMLRTITSYCFRACTALESIEIPQTTYYIQKGAFSKCSILRNIMIPDSVRIIEDYAFKDCIALATVSFNGNSQLRELGGYCFDYCINLPNFTFPNKLSVIGGGCFNGCTALTTVNIPKSVGVLPSACFSGCSLLHKINGIENICIIKSFCFKDCISLVDLSLPSTIKLDEYSFVRCSTLNSINAPLVREVPEYCFKECKTLTNINMPMVTKIEQNGFLNCEQLQKINFTHLVNIEKFAFKNCDNLQNITIPSIEWIQEGAFLGCSKLEKITLPYSLSSLGDSCFKYCQIKEVYCQATTPPFAGYTDNIGINRETCKLIVPSMFKDQYLEDNYWKEFKNIESTEDKIIYNGLLFHNDKEKNELTLLPNNYTEEINIPNQVNGIKVTAIGNGCFARNQNIKTITIPQTIQQIGSEAFVTCKNLESLSIPSSVKVLGNGCFEFCENLKQITLPQTLDFIGRDCFMCCSNLSKIDLSKTEVIPNSCFYGCTNLAEINIPESVYAIGETCFYKCKNISDIVLPESITVIDDMGFMESRMGVIYLPSSLKYIGSTAFESSSSKNIKCASDIPPIVEDARTFRWYNSGKLYVPKHSIERYRTSDGWRNWQENIYDINGKPCTPPSLTYSDNAIVFTSDTNEAEYHYTISNEDVADDATSKTGDITLKRTYKIAAYTASEGQETSETVDAVFCWGDGNLNSNIENNLCGIELQGSLKEPNTKKTLLQNEDDEVCQIPTITYSDGILHFRSETEGIYYRYSIKDANVTNNGISKDGILKLIPIYEIEVNAERKWNDQSDIATATLIFTEGKIENTTTIQDVQCTPIIVSSHDGCISISGTRNGEHIICYNLQGETIGTCISKGETITFTDKKGIVLINIGNYKIKVLVK